MSQLNAFWRKQQDDADIWWTNHWLAADGFPPLHQMSKAQITEALALVEKQRQEIEAIDAASHAEYEAFKASIKGQ